MAQYDMYIKTNMEDRIIVYKDGKRGVIDSDGNIIIPIMYDDISIVGKNVKLFKVQFGKPYECQIGLIDINGKEVLPPVYETLRDLLMMGRDMYVFRKNRKYGVYNAKTGKGLECIFDYINACPIYDDLIYIKVNGFYGIYNDLFEQILPREFNGIDAELNDIAVRGGYLILKKDKKTLISDKQGNVLLTLECNSIVNISDNVIVYENSKKLGMLDFNGSIKLPVEYAEIKNVKRGIWTYKKKKGLIGIIFTDSNKIIPEKYDKVVAINGYIFVWQGDKCNILNEDGTERFDEGFECIEPICNEPELFAVKVNGQYGIIKQDGSFLVNPKYDKIYSFEYGFAVVQTGIFSQGLINIHGYEIFPTVYQDIEVIDFKYIKAKKDYKWGLFETNGKILLPTIYDKIHDIEDNCAEVFIGKDVGIAYFEDTII